jgi:galactokinase
VNLNQLKEKYVDVFGGDINTLKVFSSPGRVNLIGEHIDYNGGPVLPAALTMDTTIIVGPRNDDSIGLAATDLEVLVTADFDKIDNYRNIDWGNYQIGVAYELMNAGHKLRGCNLLYHSTIPFGSGLSSSASIEVATALALLSMAKGAPVIVDDEFKKMIALLSQKAENEYVGVNCGIMDQFASAFGKRYNCILLDCKTLEFRLIPINLGDYKLVLANTNKKHSLGQSKYNERRAECDEGFKILKKELPDITCLADVSVETFNKYQNLFSNETIKKRVMHVVCECDRVLKSVAALENGELKTFGKLMNESHDSLRDLYEVTGIELDTLADEARKMEGVLGSRMTGAGFGGCTVNIVRTDCIDNFTKQVGEKYKEVIGYEASFYVSEIGDGCREI